MGKEKLSPLHGDKGSIRRQAVGNVTTGLGKGLL